MKEIILAGSANAGKTTVFNMLTNSFEKTGNWHGVTVDIASGKVMGGNIKVYDLPGLYSLKTYSMEEKLAVDLLREKKDALILNIVDANDLNRGLELTKELLSLGKKVLLCINFANELRKGGGKLSTKKLEEALKIPIIEINGQDKKTAGLLLDFIHNHIDVAAKSGAFTENYLVDSFYKKPPFKESLLDKLLLSPFAILLFLAAMLGTFYMAFGGGMPGDFLKVQTENLVFNVVSPSVKILLAKVDAPAFLISFICDALLQGIGLLLAFLPQLCILFLTLTALEESGFISRLAFMSDGLFNKVGLTGRAVFSLLMGFGCTTTAILTTRGYEDKSLQKRTVLILPFISCSAKLPVYVLIAGTFFTSSALVIFTLYLSGVIFSVLLAALLNVGVKSQEEFIIELPKYRLPRAAKLFKSVANFIAHFIIRICTAVLSFIIIIWLLKSFDFQLNYLPAEHIEMSILAKISQVLKYLFYPIGIKSWQISLSLLSGLIAKETVVSMLHLFYPAGLIGVISPQSALALLFFIMAYTTCISAVAAACKEIGTKTALFFSFLQLVFALLLCYVVYFIVFLLAFYGIFFLIAILFIMLCAALAVKKIKKLKCRGCKKNCKGCKI